MLDMVWRSDGFFPRLDTHTHTQRERERETLCGVNWWHADSSYRLRLMRFPPSSVILQESARRLTSSTFPHLYLVRFFFILSCRVRRAYNAHVIGDLLSSTIFRKTLDIHLRHCHLRTAKQIVNFNNNNKQTNHRNIFDIKVTLKVPQVPYSQSSDMCIESWWHVISTNQFTKSI